MQLDIYRRPERDGSFSYLAVPASREIPQEAINTDWEVEARALYIEDDAEVLPEFDIDRLQRQLEEKGYAMTALH